MNVVGAKICDELPYPETRDIVLPNQTDSVSQIAVDVRIFFIITILF